MTPDTCTATIIAVRRLTPWIVAALLLSVLLPHGTDNILHVSPASAGEEQKLFMGDTLNPLAFNLPLGAYEIVTERTEKAGVFNLGGNKRAAVSFAAPLFVKKGEAWIPVEKKGYVSGETLVFDRLAEGVEVRFDLTSPRFTLSQYGYSYTMAFEGAAPGTPEGDHAIIYRLNDGALLRWTVVGNRVQKEIVVEKAGAAKDVRFTITPSANLVLTQEGNTLLMKNRSGSGVFTTNQPHLLAINGSMIEREVSIRKSDDGYQFIYDETGLSLPYILDPSSGPNSPTSIVSDETIGDGAWTTPSNAGASDDVYTLTPSDYGEFEYTARLVVGGVVSGADKSTGASPPYPEATVTYGGASDLWSLALTPTNVNASNFGFAIAYEGNSGISNYLFATNFGFSIPSSYAIDGVSVAVDQFGNAGELWVEVDHIRMTVYYTLASPQGPNNPGTVAEVTNGTNWEMCGGLIAWTNISNVISSDNAYTTSSTNNGTSRCLKATNYGFAIPTSATIDGVVAAIERKCSARTASNYCIDAYVQLVKADIPTGSNKAETTVLDDAWQTTDSTQSYGGAADLWSATLTPTNVNATDFGLMMTPTFYFNIGD